MKKPVTKKAKAPLKMINAKIETTLFDAIKEETAKRDEFKRDAIIWGLQAYLLNFAPKRAKELKIEAEK